MEKLTNVLKGLKNALKYPLGIPVGFPREPGSLGSQLERIIKENLRKTTKHDFKTISKMP